MLTLTPVVDAGRGFITLDGATSLEDVGRIVMAIGDYGEQKAATPLQAATLIATSDRIIMAGGLRLRDGDFEVAPACCCGLEDWREWRNAFEGQFSVWLGHDPSAGIEWDDPSIAVIRTGDPELDDPAGIRRHAVPVTKLSAAIDAAEAQLNAFLPRLAAWCEAEGIPAALKLPAAFDRHFRISKADWD